MVLHMRMRMHSHRNSKRVKAMKRVNTQKKLSLSLKKRKKEQIDGRFSFVSSSSETDSLKKKITPQNTEKVTQWAVNIFEDWLETRKQSGRSGPPNDILLRNEAKEVRDWLCTFVSEVRKSNEDPYCPRSLVSIMCGLSRYIDTN